MEYPSPDDPDRFEERLRTRLLYAAGAIFVALGYGIAWLMLGMNPLYALLYDF